MTNKNNAAQYVKEFKDFLTQGSSGLDDVKLLEKPDPYKHFKELVNKALDRIDTDSKYFSFNPSLIGNYLVFTPVTSGRSKYILRITSHDSISYISLILPLEDFDITERRVIFNYDMHSHNLYFKGDRGADVSKPESEKQLAKVALSTPDDYFSINDTEEFTKTTSTTLGEKI